jgi:YHS domain-containing protein
MRRLAVLLLLVVGCRQAAPVRQRTIARNDVRTIENTVSPPAAIVPPPELADEAPAPNPVNPLAQQNQAPLTPADEQLRASLPFAPAIGLDPVDGTKISIRASTPTVQYKGRLFYFASEKNRSAFQASPDQYAKGRFAHL